MSRSGREWWIDALTLTPQRKRFFEQLQYEENEKRKSKGKEPYVILRGNAASGNSRPGAQKGDS